MIASVLITLIVAATAMAQPPSRTDLHGDPLPPGAVARLGTVRLRAAEPVKTLAFSPDGKRLASRSGQWLEVWDTATGKRLWAAPSLSAHVPDLAFSPDGHYLLTVSSTSWDGVHLWNVATGERVPALVFGKRRGFAFHPDGKSYTVVTADGGILSASIDNPKAPPRTIGTTHGDKAFVLTWSADGKRLAVAGDKGYVSVWDAGPTPQRLGEFTFTGPARSIRFAPDGDALLLVTDDEVTRFAWATRKTQHTYTPQPERPLATWLSADGKRFAVASAGGGAVHTWDTQTGKLLHTFKGGHDSNAGAISADGRTVALAHDQRIDLWDIQTGKPRLAFDGHSGLIRQLAFMPDGKSIATAANDGPVMVWDAATGKLRRQFRHEDKFLDAAFRCFSGDGSLLFTREEFRHLCVWNVATGKVRKHPVDVPGTTWTLRDVEPSGKLVVLRVGGGELLLWDVEAGKVRHRVGPTNLLAWAVLSPQGQRLATLGSDEICVWDVVSGKALWRREPARLLAWLPDGRLLLQSNLAPGLDLQGFLFHGGTGERLGPVPHLNYMPRVVCSPDGRLTLAADSLGTVTLLETATALRLWSFVAHEWRGNADHGIPDLVGGATFAPDSRRFAVAVGDSSVLVFDLASLVRKLPGKPLNRAEADALWPTLAGGDGQAVFRASLRLMRSTDVAVALFRDHLKPTPMVPDARIKQLLADLDAKAFAKREAAALELRELGDVAEPALRHLLAKPPSLEVGRRVAQLLEPLDASLMKLPGFPNNLVRIERALWILELTGSPEARQLLEALAKGDARSRQTRMVQQVLARWPGKQKVN